MPDDRRPYTAESAAEHLGCSSRHVRNMCKAGKLRHFYFGRLLRIPAAAIDELQERLAAQAATQREEAPRERPYTAETAAEYLGCSARHIRNMCKEGKLLRIPADAIRELDGMAVK